jgi:hypothetical protein
MTLQANTTSSLLVLMGSLDWLTTVVGIVYFGAAESNPLMSGLAMSNLPAFTIIKLGVAFFVGFLFYLANKFLNRTANQQSRNTNLVRLILNSAYVGSMVFMCFAVLNNVCIVVARPA